MKLKHTQARKANRLCIRMRRSFYDPVWLRRFRGEYGADYREFDVKHPRLEGQVQGLKARIAAQRKTIPQ